LSGWGRIRRIAARGVEYCVRSLDPLDSAPKGARDRAVSAPPRAPVVLLHGFSGSSEDWGPLAASLAGEGYSLHAIDLPGHGATAIPTEARRFGPVETARDLSAIAGSLGLGSAHWVGYSMGGRIALHLALADSLRMASLTLESTSPGIAGAEERAARRDEDDALAERIETRGIAWFAEHWESLPLFGSQAALPEETRDALRARRLRNRAGGLAGSLRGAGQGSQVDLTPRLESIQCPALLLTGALDPKYAALSKRMAAAIPGAEHVTIPGAGHNVHLEKPEAFARALLDHWSRFDQASRRESSITTYKE